jgi:hypothetical protein
VFSGIGNAGGSSVSAASGSSPSVPFTGGFGSGAMGAAGLYLPSLDGPSPAAMAVGYAVGQLDDGTASSPNVVAPLSASEKQDLASLYASMGKVDYSLSSGTGGLRIDASAVEAASTGTAQDFAAGPALGAAPDPVTTSVGSGMYKHVYASADPSQDPRVVFDSNPNAESAPMTDAQQATMDAASRSAIAQLNAATRAQNLAQDSAYAQAVYPPDYSSPKPLSWWSSPSVLADTNSSINGWLGNVADNTGNPLTWLLAKGGQFATDTLLPSTNGGAVVGLASLIVPALRVDSLFEGSATSFVDRSLASNDLSMSTRLESASIDGDFSVSGAAANPRMAPYMQNAGGVVRTEAEALDLARSYGVHIPDDVNIGFIKNWTRADADAEYFSNARSYNAGDNVSWADFYNDRTNMIPVRVNYDLLSSDEALVAHIGHEMYELNALRSIFENAGGEIPAQQLSGLINTRSAGGFANNLHEQAWDAADRLILQMRSGGPQ